MKIKRILLTGDDGYNSIGTRLLVHFLKPKYELRIAATKSQQSGVGGQLNIATGGTWGKTTVDGVPALWVSGTPGDAIECAVSFFKKPFDLTISGINLGVNVASAIASGTIAAARRSLKVGLSPKAIAFSWATQINWFTNHHGQEDLKQYSLYPGAITYKLIQLSLKNNLWGSPLLNINLPQKPSSKIRFTKILPDLTQFYIYPLKLNPKTKKYRFPEGYQTNTPKTKLYYDAFAVNAGYISITPCLNDLLDQAAYSQLKTKRLSL